MKKHYIIHDRVREIIERGQNVAINVELDELRYNNPIRHPTQKTFEEILDIYYQRSGSTYNYVTLTYRDFPDPFYQLVLSIVAETKDIEYFIWIDLTTWDAEKIVNDFQLN
jgi:hypothetical protein